MKKWCCSILVVMVIALVGCSKPDPSEVVGQTAKLYYDYLREGRYSAFVDGMNFPDSIPEQYRSQLVDNAKMYMAQQKKEHKGIQEIGIQNATVDTAKHCANVFLSFSYYDGTTEQILVPMVEKNGVWYMR